MTKGRLKQPSASISGDRLYRLALDYAAWAEKHPITIERASSGRTVKERRARPLTWKGFMTHARIDPGIVHAAPPAVIQAIRAIFFDQQYGRAAVGEYDQRLIATYFGLVERKAIEAKVTVTTLTDEELDRELGELLEVVDLTPDARITSENGTASLEGQERTLALPVIRDQTE